MRKEKEASIRAIDELGRIVLPTEIRQKLDIRTNEKICLIERDDEIVLKKYKPSCAFCGSEETLVMYNKKYICKDCSQSINSLF